MDQYFTKNPTTKEDIYSFDWNVNNTRFVFNTSNSVFCKHNVDFGSMLMIETFLENEQSLNGSILDLGCGYGPVGVILGRLLGDVQITMVDVNQRALNLAKMNAETNKVSNKVNIKESSAFENITDKYDRILTNPPIRAGKEVVYSFFEGSYDHLNDGGKLYVVIQKKQGAKSAIDKITSLFGNCETINKKSGYFILCATK